MGAVAIANPFPLAGTGIDAVTNGSRWELDSTRAVTWALADGFAQWTDVPRAQSFVSSVLKEFEKVANIKFQYVGHVTDPALTTANIVYTGASFLGLNLLGFPIATSAALARAFFPVESLSDAQVNYIFGSIGGTSAYPDAAGDVWLNVDPWVWPSTVSLSTYAGSYLFFVVLHETGHALGLKHPHDDGGTGRPTYSSLGYSVLDIDVATIMSYNESNPASYGYVNSGHPGTPMVADIVALQWLYGPNLTTGAGNDIYRLAQDGVLRTIWDVGGTDTFDARQLLHSVVIDLDTDLPYAVVNNTSATLGASGVIIENAYGGPYPDSIYGNPYSNFLSGGGGNDFLDGRGGVDFAIYYGKRSSFSVAATTVGNKVTDRTTAEGMDTLLNVERLQFTDLNVALDTNGAGGQAYRIYQAAFNRTPDLAGVGYWIAQMDRGMSTVDVAARFIDSAEFRSLYGSNPTTGQVVNAIYGNVLHRNPDQAGYNFYVNQIVTHQKSLPKVLADFSESPENQLQVLGTIEDGFEYVPWLG